MTADAYKVWSLWTRGTPKANSSPVLNPIDCGTTTETQVGSAKRLASWLQEAEKSDSGLRLVLHPQGMSDITVLGVCDGFYRGKQLSQDLPGRSWVRKHC